MVAAIVAGCSDPYVGRKEVSGTVTLQGQPIKDGSIIFYPLDSKETQGGAQIIQGEYKMAGQNGLKPGKYLIRLTAGDGKTRAAGEQIAAPGGSTNIVSMDLIPEDWCAKSGAGLVSHCCTKRAWSEQGNRQWAAMSGYRTLLQINP
jgi:hypothetical protein